MGLKFLKAVCLPDTLQKPRQLPLLLRLLPAVRQFLFTGLCPAGLLCRRPFNDIDRIFLSGKGLHAAALPAGLYGAAFPRALRLGQEPEQKDAVPVVNLGKNALAQLLFRRELHVFIKLPCKGHHKSVVLIFHNVAFAAARKPCGSPQQQQHAKQRRPSLSCFSGRQLH